MKLSDLLQGEDGKLSQAKLAGATGHLLFALAFMKQQVLGDPSFADTLWWVYGTFAIGHPVVNKSLDLMKKIQDRSSETKEAIARTTGLPPDTTMIGTGTSAGVTTTTSTKVD